MELPRPRLRLVLLASLFAAGSLNAAPSSRPEVTDLRALMFAAIDSPDGTASGTFVSKEALAVARQMKTNSPLKVDVVTLKVYAQEGCRRLQMTIHAEAAVTPRTPAPHDQDLVYGFDFCRDGRPPRSREVRP